jgi:hypothetical protein
MSYLFSEISSYYHRLFLISYSWILHGVTIFILTKPWIGKTSKNKILQHIFLFGNIIRCYSNLSFNEILIIKKTFKINLGKFFAKIVDIFIFHFLGKYIMIKSTKRKVGTYRTKFSTNLFNKFFLYIYSHA